MLDATDRLYQNSRREAVVVALAWLLALAWTVGYCYLRGYQHAPDSWVVKAGWAAAATGPDGQETFEQVAGLPRWVVYGIVIPWLACSAFTVIFALLFIRDDNLGAEAGEGANHGH